MPEFPLDPELAALKTALGGLTPAPAILNRDRLLFEAGRRSVRSRTWPMLAGLFAVLSAGLGARLATAPAEQRVVYLVEASRERPESGSETKTPVAGVPARGSPPGSPREAMRPRSSGAVYLQQLDQVMRFGADSLPTVALSAAAPQPSVEHLLGLPSGTLTDTQKSRWEHQLFGGGV